MFLSFWTWGGGFLLFWAWEFESRGGGGYQIFAVLYRKFCKNLVHLSVIIFVVFFLILRWASFVIGVFNVCIAPTISIIIIRAQACVCLGSEIHDMRYVFCYFWPGNFLIFIGSGARIFVFPGKPGGGGVPDFCSNI